jgi:outer membrane cobalamin receptor
LKEVMAMQYKHLLVGVTAFLLGAVTAEAQIFGTVRGNVHDPQQAPMIGVTVTLKAHSSSFTQQTQTDERGDFTLSAIPAGSYTVTIEHQDFRTIAQELQLAIDSAPVLSFTMEMATAVTTVDVAAALETTNPEASSPPVTVSKADILQSPGAERATSMAFITNFVPGSYMLHDHLHMRGGHEVSWLVDGVPIPNTNISTNVGRQIDPKDIETVEVSRGGYSAKFGDRTYGMVNIVTRSGFEFENEGELTASYGSLNQTHDQLSFGGHSAQFAYYASVSGSRTDLGLEPPTMGVIHNQGAALGGFTSMTYNASPRDQLRLSASLRNDHYQIPNTSEDQAAGYRDADAERDSFVNLSWVRTLSPGALLTISPFYHNNNAQYNGGLGDPLITTSDRVTNYVGAQTTLAVVQGPHNLNLGLYGFYQHDNSLFGLTRNGVDSLTVTELTQPSGGVSSAFVEERFQPWKWLTFNGGLRATHYSGEVNENAANPRLGTSVELPRLRWVLRGYYGYYYQPPPLSTIGGPLLNYALAEGFGFLPLHGERDRQKEAGLTIPVRGWILDLAHFQTDATNFADHDVLGNSNITLPLSIEYVRVRGYEGTIRSPQIRRRVRFHLAYSNQVVKGRGRVTGGMTSFEPPSEGYFYIDHDQRDTVAAGAETSLPGNAWVSFNLNYGSGFLDVNGPAHLPQHTTGDFSVGKSFGERWSFTLTALNIADGRYLLGKDSAFAGTHYNDPRQIIGQLRYRFHF